MIRPKVIVVVLLAGLICLGIFWYASLQWTRTIARPPEAHRQKIPVTPGSSPPADSVNAAAPNQQSVSRPLPEPLPQQGDSHGTPPGSGAADLDRTTPISNNAAPSEESVERIVKMKMEQLQELSRQSDRASMEAILAEMRSPYPEVRADALEAIVQFRSRDAIPALKELAAKTDDPQEQRAILDAVEFLELPTLDEFRAHLEKTAGRSAEDHPESR
jgi:hypothetical protein